MMIPSTCMYALRSKKYENDKDIKKCNYITNVIINRIGHLQSWPYKFNIFQSKSYFHKKWNFLNNVPSQTQCENELEINSIREGDVPGIHSIQYKSDIDAITIKHEAFSRKGFALGAVIASEWIVGKKGIFKMDDVLNI